MDIGINIGYIRKQRGNENPRDIIECAKILKNSGYKFIDFGVEDFVQADNWENILTEIKNSLDETGLIVEQTHAPFVWKKYDSEEQYKELMMRSFKASKILNANNIVIHADKYVPDEKGFSFDNALNTIYDFYAPYVDYAVKNGVGVAIENLFDGKKAKDDKDRTRFSSFIEEQIAIIDKYNDPLVTACWDTGHGNVSYGYDESIEAMKQLGSRLTATHIHDNYYQSDLHCPIFLGNTRWEKLMQTLREINYKGKFTLELVYGSIPDELMEKYLTLYRETAEFVINNY